MHPEHEDEVKSLTLINRLELNRDHMDYVVHNVSVVCRQISTRFLNLTVKRWIEAYMGITLRCRCISSANRVNAISLQMKMFF